MTRIGISVFGKARLDANWWLGIFLVERATHLYTLAYKERNKKKKQKLFTHPAELSNSECAVPYRIAREASIDRRYLRT